MSQALRGNGKGTSKFYTKSWDTSTRRTYEQKAFYLYGYLDGSQTRKRKEGNQKKKTLHSREGQPISSRQKHGPLFNIQGDTVVNPEGFH